MDNISNLDKLKELVVELTKRDNEIITKKEVLEAIIESSSDGLWDWNIKYGTAYLSPSYKEQLGYKDEELSNSPEAWTELMGDEDLVRMNETLLRHFESGGKIPFKIIAKYNHKDGHKVTILCRGKVIEWDINNNPIRMVGMHIDLTGLIK